MRENKTPAVSHVSLRHNEVSDKHYLIDNHTGSREHVSTLGQPLKRYDVRVSGISSTQARKEFSIKDSNFKLELGYREKGIKNIYSPTPNKLLGTFQFPCPKRAPDTLSSPYPSYMMKPRWHSKIVGIMQEQKAQEKLEVYNKLFQNLPDCSMATELKLRQIEEEVQKRHKPREMKPVSIDYIHVKRYHQQLENPQSKTGFFMKPHKGFQSQCADLEKKYEDQVLHDSTSPFHMSSKTVNLSTCVQRLSTDLLSPVSLKKSSNFDLAIKRKYQEKHSIAEVVRESRPVLKGTMGSDIPTPKQLYDRGFQLMQNLYPQNFVQKVNKSKMMNSNRMNFEAQKKLAANKSKVDSLETK